MAGPSQDEVREALKAIIDPSAGADIVSAGMVSGVAITDGAVSFAIEVDPARGAALEPLRQAAEAAVKRLPGVKSVFAALTAHSNTPSQPTPQAPKGAPPDLGTRAKVGDKPLRAPPAAPNEGKVDGVARIIAIGSGKGGVGKSTVSSNLAVALAMDGWKVGLLDADVYGPSQPRMLGLSGKPTAPDGTNIEPLRGFGVKCMSMGLLTGESESVIWRGPMLMSAITQMVYQVNWAPLDFLIIDLPPGTGDVQLTLSQKSSLTGAVVVSTPQDVALIDARKAIDMFQKINIPLLGMIENMSTYCCPKCGHEAEIFGHGGAEAEAKKIGAPFLGRLPLNIDVRLASDQGAPIVAMKPDSPEAERFREMARELAASVGAGAPGGSAWPV